MIIELLNQAVGPVIAIFLVTAMFSLGLDRFGSYHAAIKANMLVIGVLLLVTLIIKQVEPKKS